MYAVIETGSKQYRVEVGTELHVELLDVEPGQTITLDRVLLVADGDTAAVGQPIVDGATVSAEVLRRDRGKKLIAFKYRPKARRRVKKGHRQELTVLRVADIVFGGKSAAETTRKAQDAARTERQRLEEAAARQAAEDAALAARLAKAAQPKETGAAEGDGKSGARAAGRAGGPTRRATAKPAATEPTTQTKATDAKATDVKATDARGGGAKRETGPSGAGTAGEKKAETPSPASRRGSRTKKDG
jgi:large subunit ribosomal protein L21